MPKVDRIEDEIKVLVIKLYSPKPSFPSKRAIAIPPANENPLPITFPNTAQNESLIRGLFFNLI
jgi:hypothetical protein